MPTNTDDTDDDDTINRDVLALAEASVAHYSSQGCNTLAMPWERIARRLRARRDARGTDDNTIGADVRPPDARLGAGGCAATAPDGSACTKPAGHSGPHANAAGQVWADPTPSTRTTP